MKLEIAEAQREKFGNSSSTAVAATQEKYFYLYANIFKQLYIMVSWISVMTIATSSVRLLVLIRRERADLRYRKCYFEVTIYGCT
jgi:hypothetical protein